MSSATLVWIAVVAITFALRLAWLRWEDAREAAQTLPGPSGARPCSLCARLTARVAADGSRLCKACDPSCA
jgi:hypothetical protein